MGRTAVRLLVLVLVALAAWVNVDYWRDPVYWRRWWDTMTHLQPDYLNLSPLDEVAAGPAAPLPVAPEGERSVSAPALRAAEDYAAAFDSFALIVVHRGRVQAEWYRPGFDPGRLTQSQSMMKTVAALMVGAAIADGAIGSVDDPLERYVPEWRGDPRGAITIRNLLTMSSGLSRYGFSVNPLRHDSAFRFLFTSERERVVLSTPLAWAPGSRFEYNDVNAELAGIVVQRATRRSFADFLSSHLWNAVGGASARVWLDHEGGNTMTACCLLAPAASWARIGVMLKDRGAFDGTQVIPAAWIDQMTTPSATNAGYGLFTWIGAGMKDDALDSDAEIRQDEPFVAPDVFMLLGHGGQRVYVSRALDLVVVRLGPFNGYQPLKPGWDNARLFNLVARGILGSDCDLRSPCPSVASVSGK